MANSPVSIEWEDLFKAQRDVDDKKKTYKAKLEEWNKIISSFEVKEQNIQDQYLPGMVRKIRVKQLRLEYAIIKANYAKLFVLVQALDGEDRILPQNIELFEEADKMTY